MTMKSDCGRWNLVPDAYKSDRKYESGPGADEETPGVKESEVRVFIGNLPPGLTVEGLKNLCATTGTPLSARIIQSGTAGFVSFKTVKEAELTIYNLNNKPPYHLKVSFARPKLNKENGSSLSKESIEEWLYSGIQEVLKVDTSHITKLLEKKLDTTVSPYFDVQSHYDDPSLTMRQSFQDFITEDKCISLGRGYVNTGSRDKDFCRPGKSRFSWKSDDCLPDSSDLTKCPVCGSMTYWEYTEKSDNFCCDQCQSSALPKTLPGGISDVNIFDSFTPEQFGSIEVVNDVQSVRVPCSVILDTEAENYKLVKQIADRGGFQKLSNPTTGEKVMVCDTSRRYRRGVILSNEENLYKVALIDYGEETLVEEVYEIPVDIKNIPSFAGLAMFLGDQTPDLSSSRFRVKSRQPFNSWLCELIKNGTDEVVGKILLERWFPSSRLTYIPLESGCRVVITAFKDMRTVFVRRVCQPWLEEFTLFSNEVAACSLEGNKYARRPKYGEVCSARYINDGCYYRAIVTAIKRQSVTVLFVDYGNEQETKIEDLRYLPTAARQVNCFAVRVRLKNVPENSSPESLDYLNKLVAYQEEFSLYCDEKDPEKVEVVLKDRTSGESVNEVLSSLVRPIWKKNPLVFAKSGEPLHSMARVEFTPGETEDIFVLNLNEKEFEMCGTFWATRNRNDFLCHLNGELKRMMTEYCSYLVDDPYFPRKGELCLVEFNGDWYRGVSLDDRSELPMVFLVDFGIFTTVERKHLRKILKEFLEMPELAVECRIAGLDKLNKDQKKEICDYVKSMMKKCVKGVKIVRKEEDAYYLHMPFMDKFLGEEEEELENGGKSK